MTEKPETYFVQVGENEATINSDGSASVTSSGGVEMVIDPDGTPRIAGLTGYGIDDLADVERIETVTTDAGETVFSITYRDGGTAKVGYKNGAWNSYHGQAVGISIPNRSTRALLTKGSTED